jgi:hypothetical protein
VDIKFLMPDFSTICQCSRLGSEYKGQCLVQSPYFKRLEVEWDGLPVSSRSHKYQWICGRDMRSIKFVKLEICLAVTVNIPGNNYFFLTMKAGDYLESSVHSYLTTRFHISHTGRRRDVPVFRHLVVTVTASSWSNVYVDCRGEFQIQRHPDVTWPPAGRQKGALPFMICRVFTLLLG